jgi:tRNA A37 threonylcarbamoyladenosine modification protein TsaB
MFSLFLMYGIGRLQTTIYYLIFTTYYLILKTMTKIRSILLDIDTSDNKRVIVRLTVDGRISVEEKSATHWTSQALLPLIDTLLVREGIDLTNITSIHCAVGPGSYTGLRVGAAVANTLSKFLNVPLNGTLSPLKPIYTHETRE